MQGVAVDSDPQQPQSESLDQPRSPSPSPSQAQDQQPQQQQMEEEVENLEQPMQEQQPQEAEEQDEEEIPDAAVSPPRPPAAPDARAPPPTSRKFPGKKRRPLTGKKLAAVEEKLDLLRKNLHPVPFAPGKTLDFARHESLFRALGLWDFAHLALDRVIRGDLLAHLIANYDPPNRRSFVNEERIAVSRADLARALSLPVKKERSILLEYKDADHELFAREESIAVIMDFMSNWVLFQGEGDEACILPADVMAATQFVKDGQPQKVDWAGLIWTMVEKELVEVPRSGQCYYASHLQRLMKHQKQRIFEEEAVEEDLVEEEEHLMEVPLAEAEEDAAAGGLTSMENVEDSGDLDAEKQGAGLSLELGRDEHVLEDDIEECKEETAQDHWFLSLKNTDAEHCLQRCSLNDVQSMECEDLVREGEAGIGEEERFADDISTKLSNLERFTSTSLLQEMNTVNGSYCPPSQHLDPSSGEFLASRVDALQNMALDPCTGGSSLFGNTGKRGIDEINDDDVDDVHHFPHGDHQKRMRTDGPWDHTPPAFEMCLDQVQVWMGKAKMVFAQKEEDAMSAQMQLQYVSSVLQQKDHLIQSMEKSRLEEQHKWQEDLYRFDHELSIMAQMVQGYKKALMETRHNFAEYRKQFPQGDEPLYKDDHDAGGGTVLTTRELERRRLEKEEELERKRLEEEEELERKRLEEEEELERKRLEKEEAERIMLQKVGDFEREWFSKFDAYSDRVHELEDKFKELMGESNLLKEKVARSKAADAIVEMSKTSMNKKSNFVSTSEYNRALIDFLLLQSKIGLKADNSFKKDAYTKAVLYFRERFNIEITADNVKNRMQIWKKHYVAIKDMLRVNGFGWDPTKKMVVTPEDIWNEYFKLLSPWST